MSRFLVTADWLNNAPHLTPKAVKELYDSIPPYQRDARSRGIPQLGAGVIFPVPDEDLLIDPFALPDHWPRGYGLDIGWNRVAAEWMAYDPDQDPLARIYYQYDEYYGGQQDPVIHGVAIARRGKWIPGRIDPAARGRNQTDGKKFLTLWRKAIYGEEDLSLGVQLLGIANNAVESGLYAQLMLMNQGRFKVMRTRCPNWLAERRLYRRDERGVVIKNHDHAMDARRYAQMSGDAWLLAKPLPAKSLDPMDGFTRGSAGHSLSWMAGI